MHRVIIADDEPWVAYRLAHLIDWEQYGFQVIDTASNGLEAADKCLALKPDVLLSDIRMPGMDGLELMAALRPQLPDMEIVLISGYAEFAYAQQALRMGAFDYLIKQVSGEQLIDLANRLTNRLNKSNLDVDLYFTLIDDDSSMTIQEWFGIKHKNLDHMRFRFCTFAIGEGDYPDLLYEHETPGFGQIILRTGKRKASALLYYDKLSDRADEWQEPQPPSGYSEEVSSDAPFSALLRQSDIAFLTAKLLQKDKPVIYAHAHDSAYLSGLLHDLGKALASQNDDASQETLRALKQLCHKLLINRIADVHDNLVRLFKQHNKLAFDLPEHDYRSLASEYASLDDMFEPFHHGMAQPNQEGEFSLPKILRIIDENYRQDLRISDLAKQFHFTPSYLGTLFRKHTGQTLIKYITDKRIDYAKKLLQETDMPIQDVAERCGYNDYFQFNKAFKRNTNYTPGQFRKK